MHLYRFQMAAAISAAGSSLLLGPNGRRKAVIISAPVTNRITLSFGGPAVLDKGINLYPGSSPLVLGGDWCLCWITEDIFAISAVADQVIGVVDIFGEDDAYPRRAH